MQAVVEGLRERGVILPASARIERIGLAGRARARKRALDAVAGAVTAEQATPLDALLVPDPTTGVAPIAWLRDSTGVLPRLTLWVGPRTEAAGLVGITWPITSQSNSRRTAGQARLRGRRGA